jgi:23S rRNA pseudouridine2604 synthase
MRINKYLSESGVCSRREADRLIESGVVKINGLPATLGTQVEAGDSVTVNGTLLEDFNRKVYLALNKPVGVECTANPKVKNNIIDFVNYPIRIFPVGRLDKNSEGLILLTNDGELSNGILKARYFHEKEYVVQVDKPLTPSFIEQMQSGVQILDTVTRPCKIKQLGPRYFNIILTQGLNRQIRRMCEALDYKVLKLKRIRVLNIMLGDLPRGKWRELTKEELDSLRELVYAKGTE